MLAQPREALAQARGLPTALRDPRLSRAGNWLARHLTQALEALVRMENWLRTPNERELRARDREILEPLLARVGDQASVVAELVLGPGLVRTGGCDERSAASRDRAAASGRGCRFVRSPRTWASRAAQSTRVLARVQAQRDGRAASLPGPRPRHSIVDPFEPILKELLARYPNLTVERALQELRQRGFSGGYTVVRQRVRLLRPRPAPAPVPRFETGPGQQAQMDYGVYDIDFTREGRRRVYLFSYLLGYSRRQYLRLVESMDLLTTLREHVHAFHHLGGVARVCLYDNFKAVVLWHDADGPLYNPKFLAFATHYGFRPQACRVRRPQTKGKVRAEVLLCRNQPAQWPHLRHAGTSQRGDRWWLAKVADVRVLRDFKESPRDRHAARTAAPVAAADLRLRHGPGGLSPRQRRRLRRLSAELVLGAVVVHRPGAAGAHHRRAKSSSTRSAWKKLPGIRSCPARRPACGRSSRAIIPPTIRASGRVLLRQRFGELGPDRGAVPRRPAGQADPGQAASPATTGAGGPLSTRRCAGGPGACRPLRRLLPGCHSPHPRRPGPAQATAGRTRRAAQGRASIRACVRNRSGRVRPATISILLSPEEADEAVQEKPPEPTRTRRPACVTRSSPTSRPCVSP